MPSSQLFLVPHECSPETSSCLQASLLQWKTGANSGSFWEAFLCFLAGLAVWGANHVKDPAWFCCFGVNCSLCFEEFDWVPFWGVVGFVCNFLWCTHFCTVPLLIAFFGLESLGFMVKWTLTQTPLAEAATSRPVVGTLGPQMWRWPQVPTGQAGGHHSVQTADLDPETSED